MRPDDLLDRFRIDPTESRLSDHKRREPVAAPAPLVGDGFGPARLDPARAVAEPTLSLPAPRYRTTPLGPVASLCLHLLPLLALLEWRGHPIEVPPPIPVQLVIERPPPPPPPQKPVELKAPPRGRLASEDIGQPASQPDEAKAPDTPDMPAETQVAAAPEPAPKAAPSPQPVVPPPPEIKPVPEAKPPQKRAVASRVPPNPHPSTRTARIPGPAATRDEYLAYCLTLIRRYYDMLPASLIAGRRGQAVLSIVVLDDGTIARVGIKKSSGYHDIDSQIERMVAAVGRFPPLPQWIQAPSVTLDYVQSFPEGLVEH